LKDQLCIVTRVKTMSLLQHLRHDTEKTFLQICRTVFLSENAEIYNPGLQRGVRARILDLKQER